MGNSIEDPDFSVDKSQFEQINKSQKKDSDDSAKVLSELSVTENLIGVLSQIQNDLKVEKDKIEKAEKNAISQAASPTLVEEIKKEYAAELNTLESGGNLHTTLENLQKEMTSLNQSANEAKKYVDSAKDIDTGKLSSLVQNIDDQLVKIATCVNQLNTDSFTSEINATLKRVVSQFGSMNDNFTKALSEKDPKEALKKFVNVYYDTSTKEYSLNLSKVSNAVGLSNSSAKNTASDDLWADISNMIFGAMMMGIYGKQRLYELMNNLENGGLQNLSQLIKDWNKVFNGSKKWSFKYSSPNSRQWAQFKSNLKNLQSFIKHDGRITTKRIKSLYTTWDAQSGRVHTAYKTIRVTHLFSSLSNEISALRKNAVGYTQISTKNGGHTMKKVVLTKVLEMASKLSKDLHGLEKAAKSLASVNTASKGAIKSKISKFKKYLNDFTNGMQQDSQQIQNLSNTTQANIRVQMLYYQEFLQQAPSLVETLASIMRQVTSHLSGGR
jgi:hypothetical protein